MQEYKIEDLIRIDERLKNKRKFHVGDTVYVFDGSTNMDSKGVHRYGIDSLFQTPAIIINTNLFIFKQDKDRSVFDSKLSDYEIYDTLIEFKTGEKVYVNSGLLSDTKFDLERHEIICKRFSF